MNKRDLNIIGRFVSLLTVKGKKDKSGRFDPYECDCDVRLLWHIFETLRKQGKKEIALEFLKMTTTELDRYAKWGGNRSIAMDIGNMGDTELMPAIRYIMENNSSQFACDEAALSMIKLDKILAVEYLSELLESKDKWRKLSAQKALRTIEKKELAKIRRIIKNRKIIGS